MLPKKTISPFQILARWAWAKVNLLDLQKRATNPAAADQIQKTISEFRAANRQKKNLDHQTTP